MKNSELLALARFRILDKRNGTEAAKDRLLGQMADEIERLLRAAMKLQKRRLCASGTDVVIKHA